MSDMVDKVAVRLFWKSEHLDPSGAGDCAEGEWFSNSFPESISKRDREFWRLLANDVFFTIRDTNKEMRNAGAFILETTSASDDVIDKIWRAMVDAA